MKSVKMAEGISADHSLTAIVRAANGDPARLRALLLNNAELREMYIWPLIEMWCSETIKELSDG
jgi:hypothetical protein